MYKRILIKKKTTKKDCKYANIQFYSHIRKNINDQGDSPNTPRKQ